MRLRITDTTLRDAHQSLLATRMRMDDILPIAPEIDEVGFNSVEVWGGATFDASLRFLGEDPWERLRELKRRFRRTPLQMLLRGQNIVGYRHYADDVVERFVERAAANGIDIFRIFDAVNDLRNLETAVRAASKAGVAVQGTICYTISPVHTADTYARMAKALVEMGCDSICIKDMAGILRPNDAYDLVCRLKTETKIPIQLHGHCTGGLAEMSYIKAIEAGVDVVDCAISSLSQGTAQPPCESIVAALKGSDRDTGLDLELLTRISGYFSEVRKKYAAFEGNLPMDPGVLLHQVPGGMISNLVVQLKEQGALDKLGSVLEEIPRIRADLGYPPLVTPTSQIIGSQAVRNVLTGGRYEQVSKEVKGYVLGRYGAPPAPIDDAVREKIENGGEVISSRPADQLEPELERAGEEIGDLAESEEDLLSYVLFPQVTREFLETRAKEEAVEREAVVAIAAVFAQQQAEQVPSCDGQNLDWKMAGRRRSLRG